MLPLDPVTIRVEGSVSEAPEVREKDAGDRDVDENESRLEEVGIVDRMVFSSRCFVFSQSWPSWSFTLNLMGCSDLVKSVEWGCAVSQKEFESTELGGTLVDAVKAKDRLRSVKRPLVFIQGSKSFVGKIICDVASHLLWFYMHYNSQEPRYGKEDAEFWRLVLAGTLL